MGLDVERLITDFKDLVASIPRTVASSSELANCAYLLSPKGNGKNQWEGKDIALTVMAITHGSEIGGVAVLNEILRSIQKGIIRLEVPTAFILGNVEAALRGERFLESDLNRSFMRESLVTKEHFRARELEPIIGNTRFLLDIHQTRCPSEEPFFIFPFSAGGFDFARMISGFTPIVTHWGQPFSKDGRCTDEHCNKEGGIGVTLEIGQNGLHPYQIASGYMHVIRALEVVTLLRAGVEITPSTSNNVYTWAEIIEYPASGFAELVPGFCNFAYVKSGQNIGHVNGKAIELKQDGRILFPYYPASGQKKVPAELCRIMKQVTLEELPY